MKNPLPWIIKHLALIVIVPVMAWASWTVFSYRAAEQAPDEIVIRIGHWQLEAGVREGFAQMAERYRRDVNPHVRIVQDAVPDSTYPTWVTTQMIGGTAPDIIEVGGALPPSVILSYLNRYYIPLSSMAGNPNPYNKGTPLENVPLRQTFTDGMQIGYVPEMQEYMSIPLAQFSTRIFYNKELLKRLTGRDTAPVNFREFLDACSEIASHKDNQGRNFIPIASSKYHVTMWDGMLYDAMTFGLLKKADFNRDGALGSDELFTAFKTGRLSFSDPSVKVKFSMMHEIQQFFEPGWTGLGRDEAVFLFAQQRAVFMPGGSWEATGLIQQSAGEFTVGTMSFPWPAKTDPEYGSLVKGPLVDGAYVGFKFGITRFSRHPDIAMDVLQYLSSQKHNQELNNIIGWIPAIHGTTPPPLLSGFAPVYQGMYGVLDFSALGGESYIHWNQLIAAYRVDQLSYDELAADFTKFYTQRSGLDFDEQQRDWRRSLVNNEQTLAVLRADAMHSKTSADWDRYHRAVVSRQLIPDISHQQQRALVDNGPANSGDAYQYSDFAKARIQHDATTRESAQTTPTTSP